MPVTKKLLIRGRVQGVGFRYSMCEAAERLGITGWVQNRPDRAVEAVVQGSAEQVNDIIDWAKKGPPGARVEGIDVSDETGATYHEFSISRGL